jgi:hypothetical protein
MSIILNANVGTAPKAGVPLALSQPSLRRLASPLKQHVPLGDHAHPVVVTAQFLAQSRDLNHPDLNTIQDLSIGQVEEWALAETTQALHKKR